LGLRKEGEDGQTFKFTEGDEQAYFERGAGSGLDSGAGEHGECSYVSVAASGSVLYRWSYFLSS